MQINMAHLRERSTSGGWINFAVFDAKSTNGNNDELLYQLTQSARGNGLKIDQSALAFSSGGRTQFYGDRNLVSYLSKRGVPRWTHKLDV
ncbi:hypothetical protein [Vibrio algivorus]|uniref:Uncharacterized protein n=1 Tax=Vibrio algivorus TaxID=1667024 RepID=A0A557NUK9_9VIBR|nr:hypothetical protein [Vibrio algivorus]TVO32108.1 hypothetical protein FOF44_17465 [Vibrio algivorus]